MSGVSVPLGSTHSTLSAVSVQHLPVQIVGIRRQRTPRIRPSFCQITRPVGFFRKLYYVHFRFRAELSIYIPPPETSELRHRFLRGKRTRPSQILRLRNL